MHTASPYQVNIDPHVEELQRLSSDDDRKVFFAKHQDFYTRSAVEGLTSRATALLRVDPRDAENLIKTSFWLAEELDDDFARGKANRALANLAHLRGDQSEAIFHYATARRLFERVDAHLEAAITASSSLQALVFKGLHEQAFQEAEFARSVFESHGDRLRLARLNSNYASLLFHRDRWADAAHYYEAAYRDLVEVGEKNDVAVCLGNMAVCHLKQQDFQQALSFYKRTRTYCEQNGLTALTADLDYNIAYLHYLRGQYTTALELYREARARHSELGNKRYVDLCALNEAEIYLELNLTGECADLAKDAYSGFRDRGHILESAKALTILALAESRQGQVFLALELLSQARELFTQEKVDPSVATIDLYRASLYCRAGRWIEARRLVAAADSIFDRLSLKTRAAAARILQGRIGLEVGELESARAACLSALAMLSGTDAPGLTFQANYILGDVERAAGNTTSAMQRYLNAHEELERVSGAVQTEEQRLPAVDDRLTLYESILDLLVQHPTGINEEERAFGLIEKAKSRSLTDLLAFRAYALPATQPGRSKLADQVRQLREELNWYYRQIDLQEMKVEDRSSTEVESLRRYSRQQESRLIRTLSLIQESDKEFSSIQEAFSVDLEGLRSTLPEDTTLLEYYVAKGTVLALVIDSESIHIAPVTLSSTVRDLWRALAAELSRADSAPSSVRRERQVSSYLELMYAELIEPVEELLRCNRLLIVPHASLFYLPFHAFRTGNSYLADIYRVSYAPSATSYHLTRVRGSEIRGQANGMIFFPGEDDEELARLAKRIGRTMPGAKTTCGLGVTEEGAGSRRTKARMIHLVTRGQLRDDNPMFSTVQLGAGPIHFFDLYQLRLDSDLIAISGCSPSLQADAKGNEIVGLVRGLLYAGGRSVLTTLWEVGSESWAEFAEAFYPSLDRGHSAEDAMHHAVTTMRERNADPLRWAAFALFGDAR